MILAFFKNGIIQLQSTHILVLQCCNSTQQTAIVICNLYHMIIFFFFFPFLSSWFQYYLSTLPPALVFFIVFSSYLLSTLLFYYYYFPQPCLVIFSSVHFSSVAQSCPTLCNPMNCSMPGLPVYKGAYNPTL